jgi:hypothetical protein
MATKKKVKPKAKPKARGRRGKGRGRRFALLLLLVLLVVGAVLGVLMMKGPKPEVQINAGIALTAGLKGQGPGALDSPRGLAIAPNGDLFVADLGNARVSVFGPDGAFKTAFGKLGPEPGKGKPGEFNEPSGVAVGPDGTVYVADAWNGRIQRLSSDGKYLGEWGGNRYSFYSPRNVTVDRNGVAYVADTGNSKVKAISADGKIVKEFGAAGSGDGQFREVFGVAVNSRGEVFAADPGNKKVHKFKGLPAGDFVKAVKIPGWQVNGPFWPHLACDAQDNLYVVDSGNRKVWVYDSELNYRGTLGGEKGELFASPLGVAAAADGSLWVSDVANNKLLKVGAFSVPAAK